MNLRDIAKRIGKHGGRLIICQDEETAAVTLRLESEQKAITRWILIMAVEDSAFDIVEYELEEMCQQLDRVTP